VIEVGWRPGEWQAEHWLFAGDPDNPATRIFRCFTPGCAFLTEIRREGRCASCLKVLRENGGDVDHLEQHLAERSNAARGRVGLPKETCLVERGGSRCGREAWTSGLCNSHAIQWRERYRSRGITINEFVDSGIPRPHPALSLCIVPACGRQRAGMKTELCVTHRTRFENRFDRGVGEREFASAAIPVPVRGNFSLRSLPEPLRSEVLMSLQAEDQAGYWIDPILLTVLVRHLPQIGTSFLEPDFLDRVRTPLLKNQRKQMAFLRRASSRILLLHSAFRKEDPTAGDLWDTYAVGLPTTSQRLGRSNPGNDGKFLAKRASIDFTPIRQVWLRELIKHWGRDMRPATDQLAEAVRAFTLLSQALSLRLDHDDPTTAGVRDIQKTLEIINLRTKPNGERYSGVVRSRYLTSIRRILQYSRTAGYMDSIPPGFTVMPNDTVDRARQSEEKSGRALPYRVLMDLSRAVPRLPDGAGQPGSMMNGHELALMHRAALRVLIDTGRRPNEVCSLKVGCVTRSVPSSSDGGAVEYTLTYDNHKAGRLGRTLPITRETGDALLEWERTRSTLSLPAQFDKWLFPSPSAGRSDADKHLTTVGLNRAVARLVQLVPRLEDDVPDRSSGGYLAYTGKIEPYSFRHSYAQRHADAGVDPDTLRELMDHRSIATTMGYYTVSAKRKRSAIEKLSPMSVDWHGIPAPMVSTSAYEVGSVAVPWGNCTEPSNVKAGGHACPIRFRCSGCSMYRPDPSFLPGMQEHVTQLRATLAMVEMAGSAAPWVLQGMREEIAGYDEIMTAMRSRIELLPALERDAVEEASSALRKVRAHRPMIPLTVVRRSDA
jgi:integrase